MTKKISSLLVLIVVDLLAIFLCFVLAYFLRSEALPLLYLPLQERVVSLTNYVQKLYKLFVWLVVFSYEKLYTKRFSFWDETRTVLKGTTISFTMVTILIFASRQYIKYSRLVIVLAWLLSLVLSPACRVLCKTMLIRLGLWKKKVIIVGTSNGFPSLIDEIRKNKILGYDIVGLLAVEKEKVGQSVRGIKIVGGCRI